MTWENWMALLVTAGREYLMALHGGDQAVIARVVTSFAAVVNEDAIAELGRVAQERGEVAA